MILWIFEGKREQRIYKYIEALFYSSLPNDESVVCVYDGNIYDLYNTYQKYGGDVDVVSLLKERYAKMGKKIFDENTKVSDFAEIYLFFDYDFHHNLPLNAINEQVEQMLSVFDNETENGKLYISYPMVESLRYTKQLPDENFYDYVVTQENSKNFKQITDAFSYYKNHKFISYLHGEPDIQYRIAKTNWQQLIYQNIKKANWLCFGEKKSPKKVEDISQQNIFKIQVENYVIPNKEVSILSAIALFLYDYFGESIIKCYV